MKQKGLLLILLAFALVALGFFLMHKRASAPATPEQTATPQARTFAWRFEIAESDEGLPPRTTVALITNDDVYNLGNYPGSCAEIAPEDLLEEEAAGALCWWAGSGDEIGVFKEGEAYIVRLGTQEESTAESEGFRGNFRDLIELR